MSCFSFVREKGFILYYVSLWRLLGFFFEVGALQFVLDFQTRSWVFLDASTYFCEWLFLSVRPSIHHSFLNYHGNGDRRFCKSVFTKLIVESSTNKIRLTFYFHFAFPPLPFYLNLPPPLPLFTLRAPNFLYNLESTQSCFFSRFCERKSVKEPIRVLEKL